MTRSLAIAALLSVALATPRARAGEPLVGIDARMGGGVEMGGGSGSAVVHAAPFTLGAQLEVALVEMPWTTFYGGFFVEGVDRTGVGFDGGFRIYPGAGGLRLSIGGVGVVTPYTTGGIEASGGTCWRFGTSKRARACGDVVATALFLGDDIPDGRAVVALSLVIGVGFDAL